MKEQINKINQLQDQINTIQEELAALFKEELKNFLVRHKVDKLSVYVNANEWNDGEPTSFDVYWDSGSVEIDGKEIDTEEMSREFRAELDQLFASTQVNGFHERIFGDFAETVSISVVDGQLVID